MFELNTEYSVLNFSMSKRIIEQNEVAKKKKKIKIMNNYAKPRDKESKFQSMQLKNWLWH